MSGVNDTVRAQTLHPMYGFSDWRIYSQGEPMKIKDATKIKILLLIFFVLFYFGSKLIEDAMKKQGYGYSVTTELTEFYFCDGPGADGTPLHILETTSISKITDLYLCGFLITDGRKGFMAIDVYQESIDVPIYTFPPTTKVMPGYFYLPMGDIIENAGEFRVEVMSYHKIIATTRIQINE